MPLLVVKELITSIPTQQDEREEGDDGEAEVVVVSKGKRSSRSLRRPEEEEYESGDIDVPSLLDYIRRQLEKGYKNPKDEIRYAFELAAEKLARGREPSALIDKKTFSKVMSSLKIEIGSAGIDGIYAEYSRRKRGSDEKEYIDYVELIDELQILPAPCSASSSNKTKRSSSINRDRSMYVANSSRK